MSLPTFTDEQRAANLAKGLVTRREVAELRAQVRAGGISFAAALDIDAMQKVRIGSLLEELPQWGPARSSAVLAELGIDRSKRLSGLGVRQRAKLIAVVG